MNLSRNLHNPHHDHHKRGHHYNIDPGLFRHHQTEIAVSWQLDDEDDEPSDYGHVLLPVVVSHIIDEDSPLYNLEPQDLARAK